MSERIFYVYEHWRPDLGAPFYVGKGSKGRATKMRDRNRFHTAIQGKLARLGMCVEVRMVADCLTQLEAFYIECERIAFWRGRGVELANVTDGGDGTSGLQAWNKHAVTCLSDGLIFASAQLAARHYGISEACLSDATRSDTDRITVKGRFFIEGEHVLSESEREAKIKEIKRLRVLLRRRVDERLKVYGSAANGRDRLGRNAAGPMKNAKRVLCIDDGKVFPSISEAARHYDVDKTAVSQLLNSSGNAKRKTVGGLMFRYAEVT